MKHEVSPYETKDLRFDISQQLAESPPNKRLVPELKLKELEDESWLIKLHKVDCEE